MKLYTFTTNDFEKEPCGILVQVRAENHDEAVAKAQTMRLACKISYSTDFYSESI